MPPSQYHHHSLFKNTTPIKSRMIIKSHSPKGSSGYPPQAKEMRESIEQWQKFRIHKNIEKEEERPTTTIDPKRATLMNKIGTTRRQQLTHQIQQRRKQQEIRKAALLEEQPSVQQSLELKIGGQRQPLHLRLKSPKAYQKPQNNDLYPGSHKLVHQEEFGEYFLSGIMGKDMLEPGKLEPASPQMVEEESGIKKRKSSKEKVKKRRGSFGIVTTPGEAPSQKRDISTARVTTRENSPKRDNGTKESKVAMKWGFNYKNDILSGPVGEDQAHDMISGWS